jgi:hypothetical protein
MKLNPDNEAFPPPAPPAEELMVTGFEAPRLKLKISMQPVNAESVDSPVIVSSFKNESNAM